MARAVISTIIELDKTRFEAGMRKATMAAGKFGKSLGRAGIRGASVAMVALTAATVAFAAKTTQGIKAALDLGGKLSTSAANTGEAAGGLRVLQIAFEQAGVSGDKILPTISKLQQSVLDFQRGLSTQKDLFEILGLGVGDVSGKGSVELLDIVLGKLKGIEDIGTRNAAARGLLGRSGAELGALIENADAITNAMETVGPTAARLLTQHADAFDASADILSGLKFEGFFIGVASEINETIKPFLDEFNAVDWAGKGQEFGSALSLATNGLLEALDRMEASPVLDWVKENSILLKAGKGLGNIIADLGDARIARGNAEEFSEQRGRMDAARARRTGDYGSDREIGSVGDNPDFARAMAEQLRLMRESSQDLKIASQTLSE